MGYEVETMGRGGGGGEKWTFHVLFLGEGDTKEEISGEVTFGRKIGGGIDCTASVIWSLFFFFFFYRGGRELIFEEGPYTIATAGHRSYIKHPKIKLTDLFLHCSVWIFVISRHESFSIYIPRYHRHPDYPKRYIYKALQ